MGSERDRLLKQAEIASPGDSADKREEMEVAMQQVGGSTLYPNGPHFFWGGTSSDSHSTPVAPSPPLPSRAQVCANIMEYCQTLLLHSSTQAQFSICLFSPSGSEPAGRDGGRAGQR